jgi:hypothetical protein
MLFKNIHYIALYATFWILILNLIIYDKIWSLLLIPLIIFGNYLVLTRYKKAMSFYGISFTFLMVSHIIVHIILPIYIINKKNIKFRLHLETLSKNKKNLLLIILLLFVYINLIPIKTIYFINNIVFFNIALLITVICCCFQYT